MKKFGKVGKKVRFYGPQQKKVLKFLIFLTHLAQKVGDPWYTLFSRVYQNLATSSENYRTFSKVGPHYKEKACKFSARSDYSLRPNSCVLFEIFVARRKISIRCTRNRYPICVQFVCTFFKLCTVYSVHCTCI